MLIVNTIGVVGRDTAVIVHPEVDALVVQRLGSPESERQSEQTLGKDIEDTVKDVLRVVANLVASLRHAPRDGVDEPEEDEVSSQGEVPLLGLEAVREGDGDDEEVEGDHSPSKEAKGEVTPLVRGSSEGSNKVHDGVDPDPADSEENSNPADTRDEHDSDNLKSEGKSVLDPADPEDLAVAVEDAVVVELNGDSSGAEIGGHGVVGDGREEEDTEGEVVEDAAVDLGLHGEGEDDEEEKPVKGHDSPEPVAAILGDVVGGDGGVDVENVVPRDEEGRVDGNHD